ncbi:MAG: hypothetical protein WBB22_02855 [Anaerolineae bacterium]
MEKQATEVAQGRLLTLEVRSTGTRIWLGPAWGVLCGAVASSGLEIGWHTVVALLAALLLADSLLGTVWQLAASNRWALTAGKSGNPGQQGATPALPYTLPGSAGYRFSAFLGERIARWRSSIWPRLGSSVLGLGFSSFFALLVAALLGAGPLLFTGVALLVAGWRLALPPAREGVRLGLASCFLAGLPWLMGYATFRDLSLVGKEPSLVAQALVWAGIYAAAFHAYQLLSRETLSTGAGLLNLAHLAVAAMLVIVKQPILAGIVALVWLPQVLLQPLLLSTRDGLWYLGRVQAFTMAAMMVTALAAVI